MTPTEFLERVAKMGKPYFPRLRKGYDGPPSTVYITLGCASASLYTSNQIAEYMLQTFENSYHDQRVLLAWQAGTIQRWIRENGATYLLDPGMAHECRVTDALGSLHGRDIIEPCPTFHVALPQGSEIRSTYRDDYINHVFVNVIRNQGEGDVTLCGQPSAIALGDKDEKFVPAIIMVGFWKNSPQANSFKMRFFQDEPIKTQLESSLARYVEDEMFRAQDPIERHLDKEENDYVSAEMADLVLNLMLMMQNYPEYVTKEPHAAERAYARGTFPAPTLAHVRTGRLVELVHTVNNAPQTHGDPTGRKMPTHWRTHHWRRQPHGPEWETEHPDVKCVIAPSGQRAHLIHVKTVKVNAQQ